MIPPNQTTRSSTVATMPPVIWASRTRRQVADDHPHDGHFERRRSDRVDGDDRAESEPAADHDLASPDRPGDDRQHHARVEVTGDGGRGSEDRGEGEHEAEHEEGE